jgi:hypothetical protein
MPGQGTATLDFGAFPGVTDVALAVTGQASISGTSLVEAWIFPTATAGNVVAGTGFTIYGVAKRRVDIGPTLDSQRVRNLDHPRVYGQWTVAWVWN